MIVTGSEADDRQPCLEASVDQDEDLGVCVLEAVSEESDTDVLDLPPLESVVDTNALESMFRRYQTDWQLRFGYHDYEVVVESDRSIALYPDP